MLPLALLCLPQSDFSLRFHGNGVNDIDRVKIRVDDPATSLPGPPADLGATDFTLEFWLKARAGENAAPPIACGFNINWIYGNIVFDRDRYNQDRKFGLSLGDGRLAFGVSGDGTGDRTVCGTSDLRNEQWHHVAVQRRRSDGRLWIYVDGVLEAQADGPDGDVSYPDDGVPGNFCGGPCLNSDPFLVIGAEKHDAGHLFPSFAGWIDEVRLSDVLRYGADFIPPAAPFVLDADTAALYHLDEGAGNTIGDQNGGQSNGERRFGGSPAGPEWSPDTPFRRLNLSQTPLQRGQSATFTLSNAQPGELALYYYSLRAAGAPACPPALGGLCLDLYDPATPFASAPADAAGTAVAAALVPANAPLRTAYTQAAVARGNGGLNSAKSNPLSAPILP